MIWITVHDIMCSFWMTNVFKILHFKGVGQLSKSVQDSVFEAVHVT
jgi:hypothetical protein